METWKNLRQSRIAVLKNIATTGAIGFVATAELILASGCGQSGTSFSLLAQSQSFHQADVTLNNKIDILFVVDNSSSMTLLQSNLLANFNSFMTNFQSKDFDYQIAVTTSEAYLANSAYSTSQDYDVTKSKFRDGIGANHTGVFIVTSLSVNPINTFLINANQGQNGSGDERPFSSILEALKLPANSGFLRPDSFFATVILSDEDDFSDPTRKEYSWLSGGTPDHDYNDTNLMTVDDMVAQLDQLTGSTGTDRHYNVSAITVLDNTCLTAHKAVSPASIIGQRYIDLAHATNGVLGSICDTSYASALDFIQEKIAELSTEFKLNGAADPASIVVSVNGAVVAQDSTNGWTYDAVNFGIIFHGNAIPPASGRN